MRQDEVMIELRETLAALYEDLNDCRRIAHDAGLNTARIAFGSTVQLAWQAILSEAQKQYKVLDIIDRAVHDYSHTKLSDLRDVIAYRETNHQFITPTPFFWKSSKSSETLEKIMGARSTLLPISWLEVGFERSHSIARILLPDGGFATGILLEHNRLLTCHHVLPAEEIAQQTVIQFNYQQDSIGNYNDLTEFHLDPATHFQTSLQADWTIVHISGNANAQWGAINLRPTTIKENEYANIIQHPSGGPKQIACYHNIIAYADETYVQYLTDTLPGSSGSPVFDSQWNLIALHHSGGRIKEPATERLVYRNEGININAIIKALDHRL